MKKITKFKKIGCFFIAFTLSLTTLLQTGLGTAFAAEEMRAVWISTVFNLDYPKEKEAAAQKREFDEKLDFLKNIGFNTVIVQVRCSGDAFYSSSINPWSQYLTGTQGKDPGWDPLEYMISSAHSKGMELHAWLNPYRVTTSGTDVSVLSENHPARLHPDWVITHNDAMVYNPELEEVKKHIVDTVSEIVKNYNVDGIHFDDYFYPSNYPLPEGESKDGKIANARREHINDMVGRVSQAIKAIDSSVSFGISPRGIWKNDSSGKWGSIINGSEGYYAVYADALNWIYNGYIDYIVPQIYWESGKTGADYNTIVRFWADAVSGSKTKLYIGEAIYKEAISAEIYKHWEFCQTIPEVEGQFFFSLRQLEANLSGCADSLKKAFAGSASGQKPILETPKTAVSSGENVEINGKKISFGSYNIDGYNYFKLRDLAYALTNTGSRFEVIYDSSSETINLHTQKTYTPLGGELSQNSSGSKNALLSSAALKINDKTVNVGAYNIDGYTYFKLRDLSDYLGFGVTWNETEKLVGVFTPGL